MVHHKLIPPEGIKNVHAFNPIHESLIHTLNPIHESLDLKIGKSKSDKTIGIKKTNIITLKIM